MRVDEEPDLVMMSPYKDIDLDDTPIVVLGCKGRHFFTVETLDGIIGMKDVYNVDPKSGAYYDLKVNIQLAPSIPQCPTCREPVRQYATQRYNRLVNRAVIDEMSKRFVVSGQQELQQLSSQLQSVEQSLEDTRAKMLRSTSQEVVKAISNRYVKLGQLETSARKFLQRMNERHKPSHRLYEAIMHVTSKHDDLSNTMANMTLTSTNSSKKPDRDQRITLGGRFYHLKVRQSTLNDKFELLHGFKSSSISFPGGSPIDRSGSFLSDCEQLIKVCKDANSPNLAVEATMYYANIACQLGTSGTAVTSQIARIRDSAKALLEDAEKMCGSAFQGRDQLKMGIEQSLLLLGREFYAEVTKEEIDAIKRAMVSGRGGIATHSGHWYNCENGHPVSTSKEHCIPCANFCSSLSASAACRCSLLLVRNVAPKLVARVTQPLLVSLVRGTWKVEVSRAKALNSDCRSVALAQHILTGSQKDGKEWMGGLDAVLRRESVHITISHVPDLSPVLRLRSLQKILFTFILSMMILMMLTSGIAYSSSMLQTYKTPMLKPKCVTLS